MMILTEIGEIGVHLQDKDYLLRPSLYAMSQLGEPAEIINIYAQLMYDVETEQDKKRQLELAIYVIYCCSETDDMSDAFGFNDEYEGYVKGQAEHFQIIGLARCLLKHGITGALAPLPKKIGDQPEYVKEFNARDHVSLAMAHLGVSERDAWQMTMTSLVGALRAKFPSSETNSQGANLPTKEEFEATMAWADAVEKKRMKKQGVH